MPSTRILFLPGAGGDGRFWKPVADRLQTPAEKVLIDWPGLGHIPMNPQVNGFSDLVDRVMEELREPADLVAQSMGGSIAIAAVLKRPESVRRLVLTATSCAIDASPFHPEDWRPDYRRQFPQAAPWIMESRVGRIADEDLRRIRIPTLLLWGDADPITPLALGNHLASLLPWAQLVIVPGGDHTFAAHRAADVAPLVARHLGI